MSSLLCDTIIDYWDTNSFYLCKRGDDLYCYKQTCHLQNVLLKHQTPFLFAFGNVTSFRLCFETGLPLLQYHYDDVLTLLLIL